MGRPKGSKDKKKRATRRITDGKEERAIIEDYNAGLLTNKQIFKKYSISTGAMHNIRDRHNIPSKHMDHLLGKAIEHKDLKGKCGIYAITNKLSSGEKTKKAYIGSSVNIYKRVVHHLWDLRKGTHYNKSLQESWSEDDYCLFVIEECTEEELLDREKSIMEKINPGALHNTWNGVGPPEDKCMSEIRQKIMKNVIVKDDGCWESSKNLKRGYCEVSYKSNGKPRYLKAHRFMYYDATGDWAQLVRHMCDNRACCNPDHLKAGSHRQNTLDQFLESDKEFEKVWIELGGDAVKVTERLGYKPNHKELGTSSCVYSKERKLGLRDRFPEIFKNRKMARYRQ